MSLPTKYLCPRYACECAGPRQTRISFHELNSRLYKTAKTMFPTEDYHYDQVSVLITYWPVSDYKTTIMPDVERLQAVLEHSYGFDIQKFAIPHTLDSPEAALAECVMNFVGEGDDRRRHLKIVYYAGGMGGVWEIDWSNIYRHLKSAWTWDILLLLNCYVPPWTWETVHKGKENVIEAITKRGLLRYSFTRALTHAFHALHKLFRDGQLPVFTTGILFNSLLDWCQTWKGSHAVGHWEVPGHEVLKQDAHDPRAIQLQPLCNHDDYHWDHESCSLSQSGSSLGSPRVPHWLLRDSPKFRLEVALNDYNLVIDDVKNGIDPWGYWLRHFPALECCITVDEDQLTGFFHKLADSERFIIVNIPAALDFHFSIKLMPAIRRWHFKALKPTTPPRSFQSLEHAQDLEWGLEREGVLTGREHGARKGEVPTAQMQQHYMSVLGSINDVAKTADAKICASWDLQGLDERSRSAELLALFEQVAAEVNKIDEKVDLRDKQQVNVACTVHNIFQNVKDRFFPPAVDKSWCVDIFADWDMPTREAIEDRDHADGWETDNDFPQEHHSDLVEGLDDPWQRQWISGLYGGDAGTWELVSHGRHAQPESETWW